MDALCALLREDTAASTDGTKRWSKGMLTQLDELDRTTVQVTCGYDGALRGGEYLGSVSTNHPCVANHITPELGKLESGALMLKDLTSTVAHQAI